MTNLQGAKYIIDMLKISHDAMLVGGCVRDLIMHRQPKDYDIVTTATPDQIELLFPRTIPVGKQFGVITVILDNGEYEVATARNDGNYDGRRPDAVEYGTMEQDALRRDFTMNALYYDPNHPGCYIDYTNTGLDDLHNRVIRCVGNPITRFTEDHLRMLRAIRFAAEFDFTIEARTFRAICDCAQLINKISAERIYAELRRIINYTHGLELLKNTGLLYHLLPEVAQLEDVPQNPDYHPEGDVLTHTLKVVQQCVTPVVRWAALLHDTGKLEATFIEDGKIKAPGHEEISTEIAERVCRRLKMPNEDRECITWIVQNHMRIGRAMEMRTGKRRRFMQHPDFMLLMEHYWADCIGSNGDLDTYYQIADEYASTPPEVLKPEPLLTGKDLIAMGLEPGPVFGEIFRAIEEGQLEGTVTTKEHAIKIVLDFCTWL